MVKSISGKLDAFGERSIDKTKAPPLRDAADAPLPHHLFCRAEVAAEALDMIPRIHDGRDHRTICPRMQEPTTGRVNFPDSASTMVRMGRSQAATDFYEGMRARTRAARKASGHTQEEMAELLEIDQSAYEKYETRTPIPHHLIQKFCLLTKISSTYLLTGKEDKVRRGPAPTPPPSTMPVAPAAPARNVSPPKKRSKRGAA